MKYLVAILLGVSTMEVHADIVGVENNRQISFRIFAFNGEDKETFLRCQGLAKAINEAAEFEQPVRVDLVSLRKCVITNKTPFEVKVSHGASQ